MNILFLTAEVVQTPGVGEALEKFGINIYNFLSQVVCFLILACVLNRFVFKPIIKIVDQRRKDAEEAVNNNNNIKKILKETEDAKAEILRKAHEHAEKLIMETMADADLIREQEVIRTEKLVSQMITKAKEESLLNRNKIMLELKNEIAEMIVNTTAIITKRKIPDSEKQHLVDCAIQEMSSEISETKTGDGK